ncbi:MAG: hypothetical protein WCV88_05620 [Patescibacteria group bacterium]
MAQTVYKVLNFDGCKTIPDVVAKLVEAKNFGDGNPEITGNFDDTLCLIAHAVSDKSRFRQEVPEKIRDAVLKIVNSGVKSIDISDITNLLTKDKLSNYSWTIRRPDMFVPLEDALPHCQTPADLVVVLTGQLKEVGITAKRAREIRDQMKVVVKLCHAYNAAIEEGRPEVFNTHADWAELPQNVHAVLLEIFKKQNKQLLPVVPSYLVDEVIKKDTEQHETTYETAPTKFVIDPDKRRLWKKEELQRLGVLPEQPIEPNPSHTGTIRNLQRQVSDLEQRVPKTSSGSWIKTGSAAVLAALLGAAGVGIYTLKNQSDSGSPDIDSNDIDSDTEFHFEDESVLYPLTAEQKAKMDKLMEIAKRYYEPFARALIGASDRGITVTGKLSTDQAELIKSFDKTSDTLHFMVSDNKVRTYIAPPGRETDIHFGSSAARYVVGDLNTLDDDLIVLEQNAYGREGWHQVEILEHETGHREQVAPGTHPQTGMQDRSTLIYGQDILNTKDYSYYLSAILGAADAIIALEVFDGTSNAKDWKPPINKKSKEAYATFLTDWYVHNNHELEPFGIDKAELRQAVLASDLLTLGNEWTRAELKIRADTMQRETNKPETKRRLK